MGQLNKAAWIREPKGKLTVEDAPYPVPTEDEIIAYQRAAEAILKRAQNSKASADEPVITGAAARVMSLRDGTKKMSKTDDSDNSRINLTDDADAIAGKIKRAKSDSHPLPAGKDELKDRPEAENLLNIYAALADQDRDTVIAQFAGQQFSSFKTALADLTVAKLGPITAQMRRLLADPAEIDRILKDGAGRARAIAAPIMDEVKKTVGFVT